MCLAVPGKIINLKGNIAQVDFCGVKRIVDVSFVENAKLEDYVLVHVGFAIQKVDEDTAFETYRLLSDVLTTKKKNE